MCGIAGIYHFDPAHRVLPATIKKMTDILAHRGPDGEGIYCSGPVGLGHRRLAILDLSESGRQPMANATEDIWIVYNGECYNHLDLRKTLQARGHHFRSSSDTDTVLHLYEEHGIACLDQLSGMYGLAIWDARNQSLLLARDRLGIKPLYYYQDGQQLVFASELKALLLVPGVERELNLAALSDYVRLMSIPEPHSIFHRIHKLLPGHYLHICNNRVTVRCYWDIVAFADTTAVPVADASAEFRRRFQNVVKTHMLADVPVGAFLSGGVDSSSVVAAATREVPQPLRTFSITFHGCPAYDESTYARQMARHCATQHAEFVLQPNLADGLNNLIWHCDEPFAISSAFALFHLSRLARESVKVVLTGDGGDEVFGGYAARHLPRRGPRARVGDVLRHAWNAICGTSGPNLQWFANLFPDALERYLDSLCCYSRPALAQLLTPGFHTIARQAWSDSILRRFYTAPVTNQSIARRLYLDIKSTLVSEMLTKVDRTTMAFGLEARVPFLDHELVEWAFRIPDSEKVRGHEGKYLVKRAMEPLVPHELLYRRKQGFNIPLGTWLRGPLAECTRDLLSPALVKRRGFFNPDSVQQLLTEHFTGVTDHVNRIFVLLALELWLRQFADGHSFQGISTNAHGDAGPGCAA